MPNIIEFIRVNNPKLADRIEWDLADAIAKRQASAQYRREQTESKKEELTSEASAYRQRA